METLLDLVYDPSMTCLPSTESIFPALESVLYY